MTAPAPTRSREQRQCDHALGVLRGIEEDLGPEEVLSVMTAQLYAQAAWLAEAVGPADAAKVIVGNCNNVVKTLTKGR